MGYNENRIPSSPAEQRPASEKTPKKGRTVAELVSVVRTVLLERGEKNHISSGELSAVFTSVRSWKTNQDIERFKDKKRYLGARYTEAEQRRLVSGLIKSLVLRQHLTNAGKGYATRSNDPTKDIYDIQLELLDTMNTPESIEKARVIRESYNQIFQEVEKRLLEN
jgi:hypothetical protein